MESVKRELLSSVRSVIEDISMPVGVAFSGGLDSSVLLDVVARIAKPGEARAIHVCHNLRPEIELDTELALVRRACGERGVALSVVTVPRGAIENYAREKKCGIEAAARRFRYRAFAQVAKTHGLSAILVAHHLDDQLETMLMRLVHGGSLSALAGMRQTRELSVNPKVLILRPFLNIPKHELALYAERIGFAWSEDSTNDEEMYLRNRVRKNLMPVLDSQFSSWRAAFARYQAQIEDLSESLRNRAQEIRVEIERDVNGARALDLNGFQRQPLALRLEILRQFAESAARARPMRSRGLRHLAEGIEQGAKKIEASGIGFALTGDILVAQGQTRYSSSPEKRTLAALAAAHPEKIYYLKVPSFGEYECGPFSVRVARESDRDSLRHGVADREGREFRIPVSFPFVIRSVKPGNALNGAHGKKNLESMIKMAELPRSLRGAVPVIEDAEGVAAVLPSALGSSASGLDAFREPSLGESVQIVYIFLSMKGDQSINV